MDTPLLLSGVDTCVLMDLAEHSRPAWQAVRQMRARGIRFIVPPTTLNELFRAMGDYTETGRQRLAREALESVGIPPLQDFSPTSLTDEQIKEVKTVAARVRREMLLPGEEWNDTKIICESALLGCAYLLTNDTHLLGAPKQRLAAVLQQTGLTAPHIISYHSILA